jgi:hypothetical protein
VLPIINGEPDPRMDKLKQWLLNIESEIQRGNAGYTIIRDRFFEIIDELAQRFALEHEVIQNSNRVTVTASDGQIPIEAVSLGDYITAERDRAAAAAALRYLQRSGRGSFVALRSGTHRRDAHMHPAWQQSPVHKLNKHSPLIQYIATTRSR